MPWWSWLLIWSGLLLALLAVLVWFAFTLFKKLMRAVNALEELGNQVAGHDLDFAEPAPDRFRPAMFQDHDDLALAFDLQRADRARRRQLRRDRLVGRGKLLQQAPLIQRTDP